MEMQDRGTRLRRRDRLNCDIVCRVGQCIRHGWRMNCTGNGASDNRALLLGHFASGSSRIATARMNPAEAPLILNGKQETWYPLDGSKSRFASFSMWQYPVVMEARWPSQIIDGSWVSAQVFAVCKNGASQDQASVPVTRIPRSSSHSVAARPTPHPRAR